MKYFCVSPINITNGNLSPATHVVNVAEADLDQMHSALASNGLEDTISHTYWEISQAQYDAEVGGGATVISV